MEAKFSNTQPQETREDSEDTKNHNSHILETIELSKEPKIKEPLSQDFLA
jgi:hypothetical protein